MASRVRDGDDDDLVVDAKEEDDERKSLKHVASVGAVCSPQRRRIWRFDDCIESALDSGDELHAQTSTA
jgi:hypothetical protein